MKEEPPAWTIDLTRELNRVMKQYNVGKTEVVLRMCSAVCSALKQFGTTPDEADKFFKDVAQGYREVTAEIEAGLHDSD